MLARKKENRWRPKATKIFEDKVAGPELRWMQKYNGVTNDSRLPQIGDRYNINPSDWESRINHREPKIPFQRIMADSARKKETKFSTPPCHTKLFITHQLMSDI